MIIAPHTKFLQLCLYLLCGKSTNNSRNLKKEYVPPAAEPGLIPPWLLWPCLLLLPPSVKANSLRGGLAPFPPPQKLLFPSLAFSETLRVPGEKGLLAFLILWSHHSHCRFHTCYALAFSNPPVQVTGMLASWSLDQIFMPRWFLNFR